MDESRESAEGQADHICKRENPDGMALDELRALKKRAELVLSELFLLMFFSLPFLLQPLS